MKSQTLDEVISTSFNTVGGRVFPQPVADVDHIFDVDKIPALLAVLEVGPVGAEGDADLVAVA